MKNSISVVVPVYYGESTLEELWERVRSVMEEMNIEYFEIIFVNDASPDGSWELLQRMSEKDERVKSVNLSRNFGQHYAISAGLAHTSCEWIVVMDCDLQDKPEEIQKLYQEAIKGHDIVWGQRLVRNDPFLRRFFSKSFHLLLGYLTGVKQDASVANFGIFSKRVINAVLDSKDAIRIFPAMVRWVGFPSTKVEVVHLERPSGESSYNFKKMVHLALDIILAYSDKPLRLTVQLGLFISFISFGFGLYTFVMAIKGEIEVLGYASLMTAVWFLGGLILMVLGVVGLYVGRIFEQVKGRPPFIVSETVNIER